MWNSVPRSHGRFGSKSPTFAVMVDGIGDPYQLGILAGVIEGTTAAGASLLCFAGGHALGRTPPHVRHKVYQLITPELVDGILLFSSTLVHDIGKGGLAEYVQRQHASMPICSIGVNIEQVPSITTDNQSGIRAVLSHLVRDHGHRRIAFVRGPVANEEAELRFSAYRATLEEHGLPYDERIVVTGDFMPASGAEAVRRLSQVPGIPIEELDAIAAANDAMALGVLEALEERGLAVPRQIAVTGFDDAEEARLAPPPLTTVRQPLERLGRQASSSLLEWVQHGTAPRGTQLCTELVVRHSCGCELVQRGRCSSLPSETTRGFEAMLLMKRHQIIDILTRAARGSLGSAGPDWPTRLLNAMVADFTAPEAGSFARVMNSMVEKSLSQGTSLETFDAVISALREQVVGLLGTDHARRNWAEDLFHTAYLVVCDASNRVLARHRLKLGRWVQTISSTCNALAATFNLAELRTCLEEHLPVLGIPTCFAVLYRPDLGAHQGELVAAFDRGRRSSVNIGATFATTALLPLEWMQSMLDGRAFAVMPLTWKQESYGYVMLELRLDRAFAYAPIADAIATAVRGAYLSRTGLGVSVRTPGTPDLAPTPPLA